MARIRLAVPAVAVAVVALFAAPAGQAQEPYPDCAPGVAAVPIWGASGFQKSTGGSGNPLLFATHPVTVAAGFPFGGELSIGHVTMDPPPPGLARLPNDDFATDGGLGSDFDGASGDVTVLGEEPGTYPFRVTWIQENSSNYENTCNGAASSSITLIPPVATVRLGKPKDTGGLSGTESNVTLKVPRSGGDLRPLEVRYRVVKKQRFPGAGAKARTFTVPMRELDPGFHANNKRTSLKVGELRTVFSPDNNAEILWGMNVLFDFELRPGAFSYGYDLDIRQAGRSVTRLRVTGRCTRTLGSMECKRKKVKLTP